MSLAQIEAEVTQLSFEELKQLQRRVQEALRREPIVKSPELLEARRKLVAEFLASDECVELESFEQDQAKDRENNHRLFASWRD
jgi:hypothetical protein